jgi:hypothetical protein
MKCLAEVRELDRLYDVVLIVPAIQYHCSLDPRIQSR